MPPGYYVVRLPHRADGRRLTIESRCFQQPSKDEVPDIPDDYALQRAKSWRDFIQIEYPKDEVFIIDRLAV